MHNKKVLRNSVWRCTNGSGWSNFSTIFGQSLPEKRMEKGHTMQNGVAFISGIWYQWLFCSSGHYFLDLVNHWYWNRDIQTTSPNEIDSAIDAEPRQWNNHFGDWSMRLEVDWPVTRHRYHWNCRYSTGSHPHSMLININRSLERQRTNSYHLHRKWADCDNKHLPNPPTALRRYYALDIHVSWECWVFVVDIMHVIFGYIYRHSHKGFKYP